MSMNFISQALHVIEEHTEYFEQNKERLQKKLGKAGKKEAKRINHALKETPGYLETQAENVQAISDNYFTIASAFHLLLSKNLKALEKEEALQEGEKTAERLKEIQVAKEQIQYLTTSILKKEMFYLKKERREVLEQVDPQLALAADTTNKIYLRSRKLLESLQASLDDLKAYIEKY